jgi:hypothetical protein
VVTTVGIQTMKSAKRVVAVVVSFNEFARTLDVSAYVRSLHYRCKADRTPAVNADMETSSEEPPLTQQLFSIPPVRLYSI